MLKAGMRRAIWRLILTFSVAGVAVLAWERWERSRVIAALEAKLDRAWATDLVADLYVQKVGVDVTGVPFMELRFVQYGLGGEAGAPDSVSSESFRLAGEEVYVDAWVVRFARAWVEAGDGLKGKSLLMFRRIFSDRVPPAEGYALVAEDEAEGPPWARVDPSPGRFERSIWRRFWFFANHPEAARHMGIRAVHGEAPHVRVQAGQVYRLRLRRSGGLSIEALLPGAVLADPDAGPRRAPRAATGQGRSGP